jgi:hypothetical protein
MCSNLLKEAGDYQHKHQIQSTATFPLCQSLCHKGTMYALFFNFIFQGLAVWALCCLAKAVLDFTPLQKSPLQNLLTRVTSPAQQITTLITPSLIPKSLHMILAALWLLGLRLWIYVTAGAYGLLPVVAS